MTVQSQMTVQELVDGCYIDAGSMEKAQELVENIVEAHNLSRRENAKTYGEIKPDSAYSCKYKDWSLYDNTYLTTTKSMHNPMYQVWSGIMNRCYNPKNISYAYYGGAGIRVHDEWKNNFSAFASDILASIGRKPKPYYSIDRIDGYQGYYPNNVRWSHPVRQARNKIAGGKISEVSGLTIAILYRYYNVTGQELQPIYNNFLAETESRKILKSWESVYNAGKIYGAFV